MINEFKEDTNNQMNNLRKTIQDMNDNFRKIISGNEKE